MSDIYLVIFCAMQTYIVIVSFAVKHYKPAKRKLEVQQPDSMSNKKKINNISKGPATALKEPIRAALKSGRSPLRVVPLKKRPKDPDDKPNPRQHDTDSRQKQWASF
jgi:hypothetical protein